MYSKTAMDGHVDWANKIRWENFAKKCNECSYKGAQPFAAEVKILRVWVHRQFRVCEECGHTAQKSGCSLKNVKD